MHRVRSRAKVKAQLERKQDGDETGGPHNLKSKTQTQKSKGLRSASKRSEDHLFIYLFSSCLGRKSSLRYSLRAKKNVLSFFLSQKGRYQ